MGQIAQARAGLSAATTSAEQAKLTIDHAERELKALGPKAAKAQKEGEGLSAELEAARARKAELGKVLEKLGGDEQRERELLGRKADVSQRINGLLEVSRPVPTPFSPAKVADVRIFPPRPSTACPVVRSATGSSRASRRPTSRTATPMPTLTGPRSRGSSPTWSSSPRRTLLRRPHSRSAPAASFLTSLSRTRRSLRPCSVTRRASRSASPCSRSTRFSRRAFTRMCVFRLMRSPSG
jgi:hypothetical protein